MRRHRLPVAAVLAAALLLSNACSSSDDKGGTEPSSSPTNAATKLISYEDKDGGGGVVLKKAADVAKLNGAPEDFKQFVAGYIDYLAHAPETTKECPVTVRVFKLDTAGFANGSMFRCEGSGFLWAKVDGVWQQIDSGQQLPGCDMLKKYSVPASIAGDTCADYKNNSTVDYTG